MGVSGSILDLVCGLPSPKRERWPIMALQAFIDDSMASGEVLVLAGYISTAEKWSTFSDEWRQRLEMRPRLARFKMNEVDLGSELQMERVRHFYRVIEDHVLAQVAIAVPCRELNELVPRFDVQQFLVNPYFLAHKVIVNVTAQLQREAGLTDPIDFVFDKRSEEPRLLQAFQYYMGTLPPEFSEVTGAMPIFRDDVEFLPLQAADLLAWWMRKLWLSDRSISKRYVPLPWPSRVSIPAIVLDLSGEDLHRELEDIARRRAKVRNGPFQLSTTFTCDLFGRQRS